MTHYYNHNLAGLTKPAYYIEALNWLDQAEDALTELEQQIDRGEIILSDSAYHQLHDQLDRAEAYKQQMYARWQAALKAEREGIPVEISVNVKETVTQ